MPQHIDVPGMGIVEFPDGMSDNQMAAAIKQNMPQQSVMDKLTGTNGPRYQTWPERAVRGIIGSAQDAVTLPGKVMQEAQQPKSTISDSDVSALSVPSAMNFATIASPVNPAVRVGDRAIPGVKQALTPVKPAAPTAEVLKAAGAADIKAAKDSGLEVTASSVGDMSRKIQSDLFDSGIHPVDAPNTFAKLKELENAPTGSFATAANLQSLRESFGHTAQNFNPNAAKDQLAATRAIRGLDEFLPGVDPKDVVARAASATPATKEQLVQQAFEGKKEAARVSELFKRGRANYAAAMRSNDLTGTLDRANTGILERAQVRAQAANSGRNLDNTIRSKVASVLEKPKEISGFSDAELAALNKVVEGTPGRNAARTIGNLLGGGGGMGQMLTSSIGGGAGAVAGGPVGAALGAGVPFVGGVTAKHIANLLAKKSLSNVDELIRMRSPVYQEMLANPKMAVISPAKRSAVIRALLLNQQQQ